MQEYEAKVARGYWASWRSPGLRRGDARLVLISVVVLGSGLGVLVGQASFLKHPVLLVGIILSLPVILYFAKGLSYEKAFVMMVVTLPLLYGFVLDIGGNLRVTYLFTMLTFLLCVQQRKLWRLPKGRDVQLLFAFVLYALASTVFTLWIDFSKPMEEVGFRLTPFRPFIQAGQLILMVMAFYLTINYVTSLERLRRFSNLVFWSTAVITLYGVYDFVAALFDLPFFSVIYDTSYYVGGIDSASFRFGDILLPRPRSTLGEPLDLSIFLLFGIAFSITAVCGERGRISRWLKSCLIVVAVLLFFVANSRGSLLAFGVVLPLFFWLCRDYRARVRLIVFGLGIYVAVGLVVLPVAGGRGNIGAPLMFYKERLISISDLPAALKGDEGAMGQIGRDYRKPIEVFEENPVLGVGLGNYPFYYSRGMDKVVLASTFSLYLRLLTELGLVGTTLFLFFVGRILWKLFKVVRSYPPSDIRQFSLAAFLGIIGVMIARVGLDGLYTDNYIWVMLAVGAAIPRIAERGEGLRTSSDVAVPTGPCALANS